MGMVFSRSEFDGFLIVMLRVCRCSAEGFAGI